MTRPKRPDPLSPNLGFKVVSQDRLKPMRRKSPLVIQLYWTLFVWHIYHRNEDRAKNIAVWPILQDEPFQQYHDGIRIKTASCAPHACIMSSASHAIMAEMARRKARPPFWQGCHDLVPFLSHQHVPNRRSRHTWQLATEKFFG